MPSASFLPDPTIPNTWTNRHVRATRISKTPASVKRPPFESSTAAQLLRQAKKAGPYKGRRKAFKGHMWERKAESVRLSREEKVKQMPARIADFIKVSRITAVFVRKGVDGIRGTL